MEKRAKTYGMESFRAQETAGHTGRGREEKLDSFGVLCRNKITFWIYINASLRRRSKCTTSEPELFLQRYAPPVLIDEVQYAPDRTQYYESYLETYINRDIRDLAQVADETAFFNFLRVVAARTATNVNYETLAAEVGITVPMAKRWLFVLNPIEREPRQSEFFSDEEHNKTKVGSGAVVCMPPDLLPVDGKNWYVPAWIL